MQVTGKTVLEELVNGMDSSDVYSLEEEERMKVLLQMKHVAFVSK